MERIPPQNIEAEQSVLGAMLTDKEAIYTALGMLKAEDFYRDAHRDIFQAIQDISDNGVDLITTTERLRQNNRLEAVGGVTYIATLANQVLTTANTENYCQIVKEKSLQRQAINNLTRATNILYSGDYENLTDLLASVEINLGNLTPTNDNELSHIKTLLPGVMDEIFETKSNNGVTGIPSGLDDLDRLTAGWQDTDFIIIAGRPSMGKTAFALSIADQASQKGPVAFFSLEMSKNQLVKRLVASKARVNSQLIRVGKLTDNQIKALADGSGLLNKQDIIIDDTPAITPAELKAKARKIQRDYGLSLIIVDYLQLMKSNEKQKDKRLEVTEISHAMKNLAKELDVPVICLSQLSRAVEQRQDKHPMMSDLRESGDLEQDADMIIFLYRDEYYNPESEKKSIAEVIIAKQRSGPVGTVEAGFIKEVGRFLNFDRRH